MPWHLDEDDTKEAMLPDWGTLFHVSGNKQAARLHEIAARHIQIADSLAKPDKPVVDNGRLIKSKEKRERERDREPQT